MSIVQKFIKAMERVGVRQLEAYIQTNQGLIKIVRRRAARNINSQNINYWKYEAKDGTRTLGWFTPMDPLERQELADGEVIKDKKVRWAVLAGLPSEIRAAQSAGAYFAYLKEGKGVYDLAYQRPVAPKEVRLGRR